MDYKQFTISAFEREPGRWRARVRRTAIVQGRAKLIESITPSDSSTAVDAMIVAMNAIDVGEFSPPGQRKSERFWRLATRGRKGATVKREQ
jgi:hypothetical protein